MNDQQVMHAMLIDDMYHVERVLAQRVDSITELVTIEGTGPFIRKKIALSLANRGVWAALATAAQVCDRLPKIAATYELPDQFAIVYEYVCGKTLEALVDAGRVSERKAVRLARDLCAAAAALHKLGMIHRDIAPKNIIVAKDGAHLVDFGISRLRRQGARKDTTSLGTWGFASPEQYGFAQTDARSDVYSIGCVLGYMLTGLAPDKDEYAEALDGGEGVDEGLRAIVHRACAFEPSKRFQSAEELQCALSHAGELLGAEHAE